MLGLGLELGLQRWEEVDSDFDFELLDEAGQPILDHNDAYILDEGAT